MNPKEHTMRQLELLLTAAGYEVRMLQSWCFVTDLAVFDFWSDETITVGAQGKSDRKSTRLNSSHSQQSRMPSSA